MYFKTIFRGQGDGSADKVLAMQMGTRVLILRNHIKLEATAHGCDLSAPYRDRECKDVRLSRKWDCWSHFKQGQNARTDTHSGPLASTCMLLYSMHYCGFMHARTQSGM